MLTALSFVIGFVVAVVACFILAARNVRPDGILVKVRGNWYIGISERSYGNCIRGLFYASDLRMITFRSSMFSETVLYLPHPTIESRKGKWSWSCGPLARRFGKRSEATFGEFWVFESKWLGYHTSF